MWEPSLARHALLESIPPLRTGHPVRPVPQGLPLEERVQQPRLARRVLLESIPPFRMWLRAQIVSQGNTRQVVLLVVRPVPQESTKTRRDRLRARRTVLLVSTAVQAVHHVHYVVLPPRSIRTNKEREVAKIVPHHVAPLLLAQVV